MNWKMLLGMVVAVVVALIAYDYWKKQRAKGATVTTPPGGTPVEENPTATRGDMDPMSGRVVR